MMRQRVGLDHAIFEIDFCKYARNFVSFNLPFLSTELVLLSFQCVRYSINNSLNILDRFHILRSISLLQHVVITLLFVSY